MGALDQARGGLGGPAFNLGAIGKGAIPRPGGGDGGRVPSGGTGRQTYRMSTLAELDAILTRADTVDTNEGVWLPDAGGSTPSAATGPGTNSAGPYLFSESSSGNDSITLVKSVITFNDGVRSWLDGGDREIRFRVCLQGEWNHDDAEGLDIQGQRPGEMTWETIHVINGWAYATPVLLGANITQYRTGTVLECVQAGGWLDFTVDIPFEYAEVRLRNRTVLGRTFTHDIAMWELELAYGGA